MKADAPRARARLDESLERLRRLMPHDVDKHSVPKAEPHGAASLPIGRCEPTEDGIALAFAQTYAGRFAFDHDRGSWLIWSDEAGLWRRDSTNYVPDAARALVRGVRQGVDNPPALLARERSWRAVERAARDDRRLAVDHSAWNVDPLVVGVNGGAVDMRTGELLPSDPHRMINLATAVRPAPPGTPHPLWSRFLDEATQGDAELQRFLAQRAGYWLTGDVSQESFDFLYGPGGNGKGVFLADAHGDLGRLRRRRAHRHVHDLEARRAPDRACAPRGQPSRCSERD
jgi:putative DNA primase/helicase